MRRQAEEFRRGFSDIFPSSTLSAFSPPELSSIFGQFEEDWSYETLLASTKADHGYTVASPTFMNLLTMIPIAWYTDQVKFFVGFQVDLVEQPNAVTDRNPGMLMVHFCAYNDGNVIACHALVILTLEYC